MNIADKAVKNALQFECKKDGLKQLQSGEWTLALKVHPADVPAPLLTAAMGTRYMAVLVEVGDDETPVEQPKQADKPDDMATVGDMLKARHRLSRQAAMCCDDARFRAFLADQIAGFDNDAPLDAEWAVFAVRDLCDVDSRAEFDTDHEAATRWRDLHAEFEAWRLT